MQGEFRADVTRDTFDPGNGFSRVLMQQGRVLLDADWNEQTSIQLHYLRMLAADLFGPFAAFGDGFKMAKTDPTNKDVKFDFWFGPGHCYVGGLLCENDRWRRFLAQPFYPSSSTIDPDLAKPDAESYLAYLDVWERHVTSLTDDRIREVALGGADTATRAQVVWQVRLVEWTPPATATDAAGRQAAAEKFLGTVRTPLGGVTMRCRAGHAAVSSSPCVVSPSARFRGTENQLYRVEIQRGGDAWDGKTNADGTASGNVDKAATIKWSRDNGSVAIPIRSLSKQEVRVAALGPDERHTIHARDWVEIVDDALAGKPGELWQVAAVRQDDRIVVLEPRAGKTPPQLTEDDRSRHPMLRRWDHGGGDDNGLLDGGLLVTERSGEDDELWTALEDGIQIQFEPNKQPYRAGDYWLVPARTALGDVLWPVERDDNGVEVKYPSGKPVPADLAPHGIVHHFAPLGVVKFKAGGTFDAPDDVRRVVAGLPLVK